MKNQTELFTGEQLRDKGIKQAENHANEVSENWSDIAYKYLVNYTKVKGVFHTFLVEDVRYALRGQVPEPPSKRAWGSVIMKAKKNGLIKKVGFRSVKNPKAHCTPATLWEIIR